MAEFIVHIKRHCGWHTTTAEGDTFAEAAQIAAVETCKRYGLDLDSIAHTTEFVDEEAADSIRFVDTPERYQRVRFIWAQPHRVFDPILYGGWGMTKPGDWWFSEMVREGQPGDCGRCGGSGIDFYNPFVRCSVCGDGGKREKAEGDR